MDEQQLGERFGRLEKGQEGLDSRFVELQSANEKDHGEVLELLTEIRADIAKKASKQEMKELADRTDKLESRSDKVMAVVGVALFLSPFVIGLLLQLTGGGA